MAKREGLLKGALNVIVVPLSIQVETDVGAASDEQVIEKYNRNVELNRILWMRCLATGLLGIAAIGLHISPELALLPLIYFTIDGLVFLARGMTVGHSYDFMVRRKGIQDKSTKATDNKL